MSLLFDFGLLPPEINSARMYSGPGSGPLMAAASAWGELSTELDSTAAHYFSAISELTGEEWLGPSSASMAAAATPYAAWMSTTAAQAEQAAAQATAAASAYDAAFAMTVPPPVVAANRSETLALIATNILGQNTAAIAAAEAQYAEMWAQDSAAMEAYAAASAAAAKLTAFTSPPPTTNPAGLAGQAAAVAQSAAPAASAAATAAAAAPGEIIGAIGDGALIAVNLSSLGSLATSLAILGTALVGLSDRSGGETSPTVALATVQQPNLATAALLSRSGGGAAVSAFTGGANSIGGLSVPQSWAQPAIRQVAAASPGAVPIAMRSQTGQDSPYTGMALGSLVGSSIAGLGFRGAPVRSAAATTPAANKAPPASIVAPNKPAPAPAPAPAAAPAPAPAPAAPPPAPAFPSAVPVAISAGGIPADVAANLAATLAGIPGATIIVIPPSTG
jgi:PPE-repeat protein